MSETKAEKFKRLRDNRLPKAVKAVELLANLARRTQYEYTENEAFELVEALDDAIFVVSSAFKIPEPMDDAPAAPPVPEHRADGSTSQNDRSYVQWAYDCLRRGNASDAEEHLKNVIQRWIDEEKGTD